MKARRRREPRIHLSVQQKRALAVQIGVRLCFSGRHLDECREAGFGLIEVKCRRCGSSYMLVPPPIHWYGYWKSLDALTTEQDAPRSEEADNGGRGWSATSLSPGGRKSKRHMARVKNRSINGSFVEED